MSMKMHKRNVLSRNKLLVIAVVLAAHVGVCATPSFSKAKPVWPEGHEKEWNCQVGFTAEFDGRDALVASNAVLRFTGATMCRVFLNGEFLGYGPARAAHGFVRVEELPLGGKLKRGRNVVAIEVAGYNCDSFYTVRQSSFLQAEIVADGKVIAATDAKGGVFKAGVLEERVRKVQRFSFQRTFSEAYEVWPHCNEWRMGIRPPFVKPCTLAEQPLLPLLPRIVPVPDYTILPAKELVATGTVKYDETLPVKTPRSMTCTEGKSWRRDGWKVSELEWIPYYDMQRTVTTSRKDSLKRQECRFPEDATGHVPPVLEIPGNGFALVDFGFLAAGFPKMTVECDGPGTLYFCFDEVLENGDFNMKRFGSCDNIVAWRLKEAGVYNLEAFEPYAFRYGKLVFFGGKCKVSELSIREYVNPEAGKAKFESSDADINKIFEAARRTFAENAVDGFMDCPSRERAGWNCDAFFTGRASIEFTGNAKEEKIFIQNFLLPEKFNDIPDGMLPQCYPADFPDHSMIPNWAMWFVLELDEYFARTGDRTMVDAFRPRILKLMDFFWKYRNDDGLLEKLPPSVFVEWSRSNALTRDVNYPTNMTWARVLEVVARLYGISSYAEEAEKVRETVRRQSWNGTFFVDRALRQKDGSLKPDTEATETCQYYAFFFDVATPKSHPELWKRLVEDFGPNRKKNNKWPDVAFSNAFIGNYLRFECLSKAGLSAQILDEAKGYFSFMAERTGTLWEHDAPTASCSHGFASHIAHVLYRDVLGVRNIDRVKKTIELRFLDVPLEHCSGEIPLEDGVLKVSWKKIGGKLSYHYEAPKGYTVSVQADGPDQFALHRAEFAKYHRMITGKDAPEGIVNFAVDPKISKSGRDAYSITSGNAAVAGRPPYRAAVAGRPPYRGGEKGRAGSPLPAVTITGSNLRSVWYGLYDLLERRGGCHWFWDGDVVPKRDSIDLSNLDVHEEAHFEYRAIRYFAHRGLTRFQAEHWGPDDWKREIDWALKRRVNVMMLRIGQDDLFQRTFPEACPYPDPAKPQRGMYGSYNDRTLFWSLQYRGELRRRLQQYAFDRGLMMPEDFGTMSHWYSPTPDDFLVNMKPPFLPQVGSTHGEPHLRVWDIRDDKWADAYWKLTTTAVDAYGKDAPAPRLLHTIGLGERQCFKDRKANFDLKVEALNKFLFRAKRDYPDAKVLLAGWDFYGSWKNNEVKELLGTLDKNQVILWDYEGDFREAKSNFTNWDVMGKFPYTYSTFLAFESALDARADYPFVEKRRELVENDPACVGWIFWPESSHTDTLFLRYYTANAWSKKAIPHGVVLDEFCASRYGDSAGKMKTVWKAVIPASHLRRMDADSSWCLNAMQHLMFFGFEKKGCVRRSGTWAKPVTDAMAALGTLADVPWEGEFIRRDTVDIVRMVFDRFIALRTDELGRDIAKWRRGEIDGKDLPRRARELAKLCNTFADILTLHTDYSLWESYQRLDAIEKVKNPAFTKTLFENAANRYCLSHQYEVVRHVVVPTVKAMAERLAKAVESGDRKAAAFTSKPDYAKLRSAAKAKPLESLKPTLPRTKENFVKVLREVGER